MASEQRPAQIRAQPWHRAMISDLEAVSPGLVYDPVGAGSISASPLYQELRALEAVVRGAESTDAPRRTHSRIAPRALVAETRMPPRRVQALHAEPVASQVRAVAEFRKRIGSIAATAESAIRAIERSRRFRDTPMLRQSTLYADVDVPRLEALHKVVRTARMLNARVAALPETAPLRVPRVSLLTQRAQRPISAMYERWVFLEIVRAFHGTLDGHTIEQLLGPAENAAVRDFDERTQYTATMNGCTLRIRFEPWILSRELSIAFEHGLYRGPALAHAWRPDIIIQVERGTRAGIPVVSDAWIIDAKLATAPRRELWMQVLKYADIRASSNDATVVRMIGLALPAPDDGGIGFFESLPASPPVPLRVLPLLPGERTRSASAALAGLVNAVSASTR